jgi:hypothetical protein
LSHLFVDVNFTIFENSLIFEQGQKKNVSQLTKN